MMTVLITLTTTGLDTGPFNLFSDVNGYTSAFDSNVPKNLLELGYPSNVVPDNTTIIRVQSVNSLCNNFADLPTGITTTTSTTLPPINSVEWLTGDYPPIAYGISPGNIISLSGTVEIIGDPVTFRAYAFLPTGPGDGAVDTSISIGNIDVGITSRYVDAVTPYDNGINQYSTSFTLPAGIYDWNVLCTFSNTASVGGEGGIDWVQ